MKIKTLEIFTPKLEEQTKFYTQVLELNIIDKTTSSVSFQIGDSTLRLIQRDRFVPYHFAINIPSNQEVEALHWLKQRVGILRYEGSEIQYFDFWNAHAIYFYDKDKNIVELIARKRLDTSSDRPFDRNALLSISEIGLSTNDIKQEYALLKSATSIPIYSGNLERFCSLGDPHGLFIIINKNLKKEWFPTRDVPLSADFNIDFIEKGIEYKFEYKDEQLRVL